MRQFKSMLPYLMVILACYILLPLVDSGPGFFLIPPVVFICSMVYGYRQPFHWTFLIFSAAAGSLFLPIIPVYFNETALIWAVIFGLITLGGSLTGKLLSLRAS